MHSPGKCAESGHRDGLFANARLFFPTTLGSDRDGNVYVHDKGNNSIRKIEFPRLRSGGGFSETRIRTLYNGACRDIPAAFV